MNDLLINYARNLHHTSSIHPYNLPYQLTKKHLTKKSNRHNYRVFNMLIIVTNRPKKSQKHLNKGIY